MSFIRQATVVINVRKGDFSGFETPPIQISGSRVSFSIIKSRAWSTNQAIVKIWNLSANVRNAIKDFGDQVVIYAGYERDGLSALTNPTQDNKSLLFIGDTQSISHIFEPPEIVTTLECGDGERYLNYGQVTVSFGAGSTARQVITAIAKQMTFADQAIVFSEFGNTANLIYRWGFSSIGMAKDVLTTACNYLNLEWSVQNNQLQIIPQNGSIVQQPIEINEQTGMQGVPQRFTYKGVYLPRPINPNVEQAPLSPAEPPNRLPGYKVNTVLNPLILPGSSIILTSNHLGLNQSPFVVETVRHEGDTYGFVWSSNLEVAGLNTTP